MGIRTNHRTAGLHSQTDGDGHGMGGDGRLAGGRWAPPFSDYTSAGHDSQRHSLTEEFSAMFLAMVVELLLIKALHWLAPEEGGIYRDGTVCAIGLAHKDCSNGMLMEGRCERQAVNTFYLEIISDPLHLPLYMLLFIPFFQ